MIGSLGVPLRELVGGCKDHAYGSEKPKWGGEEVRLQKEKGGQHGIVEKIHDIVQEGAVNSRNSALHMQTASQKPVHGIDQERPGHVPKGKHVFASMDGVQGQKAENRTGSREQMNRMGADFAQKANFIGRIQRISPVS